MSGYLKNFCSSLATEKTSGLLPLLLMYYTSPVMFTGRNNSNTATHLLDLTEVWRWPSWHCSSMCIWKETSSGSSWNEVTVSREFVSSQRMLQTKHTRHATQILSLALPCANAGQAASQHFYMVKRANWIPLDAMPVLYSAHISRPVWTVIWLVQYKRTPPLSPPSWALAPLQLHARMMLSQKSLFRGRVFVAVPEEPRDGKSILSWVIDRVSDSAEIIIVHIVTSPDFG